MVKLSTTFNSLLVNAYLGTVGTIKRFAHNDKGIVAIEYAVIMLGISMVVLSLFSEGGTVSNMLLSVYTNLESQMAENLNGRF